MAGAAGPVPGLVKRYQLGGTGHALALSLGWAGTK